MEPLNFKRPRWNRRPKTHSVSDFARNRLRKKISTIKFPPTDGRVMLLKHKNTYYIHRDGLVLSYIPIADAFIPYIEITIAILNRNFESLYKLLSVHQREVVTEDMKLPSLFDSEDEVNNEELSEEEGEFYE